MKTEIIEVDPSVKKLVDENDGYCPCMIGQTNDTKCMCKMFREEIFIGKCLCGRYEKVVVE